MQDPMEQLSDNDFFSKVANFLDDAPPEALIKETPVIKRIQDCLLSMEPLQNYQALNILRAFARKLEVRKRQFFDPRVKLQTTADTYPQFKAKIEKVVVGFADLTASLFKKKDFLPLAIAVCKELLHVTKSPPTDDIIEYALPHLSNPQLKISVLEILANSSKIIEGLPLYDPEIAIEYPLLHQQLIQISPKNEQEELISIKKTFSKIERINKGELTVDRSLLPFCDFDACFGRIGNNVLASHVNEKIRTAFFDKALSTDIDIHSYIDPLLRFNQFDKVVSQQAIQLIHSKIDAILSQKLTISQLISLQCLPMKQDSHTFNALSNYLNSADQYTRLCGWARYLYAKEEWLSSLAKEQLSDALRSAIKFDLKTACPVDTMLSDYKTRLRLGGTKTDLTMIQGLIDTLFTDSQQQFVKEACAKRLVNQYLNPLNPVKRFTQQVFCLSFSTYPSLLHALAIRDYHYYINDGEKMADLLLAINDDNKRDLLPILARSIFMPLTKEESNGASFLKLPRFVETVFEIQGCSGFYELEFYQPIDAVEFSYVLEQWVNYRPKSDLPIKEGIDLRQLTQYVIVDHRLAADCFLQLEQDQNAVSVFKTLGCSSSLLYFLVMACLSSRMSNQIVCALCDELLPSSIELGLKLAQALTEFGGFCNLPDNITELILDEKTRRSALSFVCAKINSKQDVSNVDIEKISQLLSKKLSTNVFRQLLIILSLHGRSKIVHPYIKSKDFAIKSFAFHMAEVNDENAKEALSVVTNENESIAVRVACMELLTEYYRNHRIPNNSFLPLFHLQKGETISTFFLLRLLSIPDIRAQIPQYVDFILPYLTTKASSHFVFAALYTLPSYEFADERLTKALMELINHDTYTDTVLHLMTTFSQETLAAFTSEMLFYITDTFVSFDIYNALVVINRMLLAGIHFPDESTPLILNLYKAMIEQNIDSPELRMVLMQAFQQSKSCKIIALKKGFLELALAELMNANDIQYYDVLKMCTVFIYNYPRGQTRLLEKWGLKTLHTIFEPNSTVLNFFLAFVKMNETTQQCFADFYPPDTTNNPHVKPTSLLDRLLEAIDKVKKPSIVSLLLELFSNVLNGRVIRNKIFFNTKLIPHYVTHVQKYANERKVGPLEGWLRVFIMLSLHPDG